MLKLKEKILNLEHLNRFKELYSSFDASVGLENFEAYTLYLFIRTYKPKTIIEMSPDCGFSTYLMINAICDEGYEDKVKSFDSYDLKYKFSNIARKTRTKLECHKFFWGDVKQTLKMVDNLDFFFIDSNHSFSFAQWYSQFLDTPQAFFVHDIDSSKDFHQLWRTDDQAIANGGEPLVLYDWLENKGYSREDDLITEAYTDGHLRRTPEGYKALWTHSNLEKMNNIFWSCMEKLKLPFDVFPFKHNASLFYKK